MTQPIPSDELDRRWMQRALALARRGIGLASPNPAVGCVLLDRKGQLAGEGWHEYERRDHAELAALKAALAAGREMRGGTAYVTLEPCNHTGRTGPCTQALIAAGLGRVAAATIDPNPQVAGRGLAALRAAGLATTEGICRDEARRLNEGFACWIQHGRPFVLMKVAMTLDGRIAPALRAAREPHWITGEEARAAVQSLRRQADAVVTGIETVLADDPLLTDRSGQRRRRRLLRVVLDSGLRMPPDCKLAAGAQEDVLVFTACSDPARVDALRKRGVRVAVLPAKEGRIPLDLMLRKLGEEGVLTLLTESGSRLNTALLAGGFVDRVQFFVNPQMMGSGAVPAFGELEHPLPLATVEVKRHGNDLGLSSLLRDPWPRTSNSETPATLAASI